MHNSDNSEMEQNCKILSNAFEGLLSWKWDSRFDVVLAEFSADNRDRIRAILNRYLSITWNSLNIDQAPDNVQNINFHLGKLRAGQLLFTSDPTRDSFLFCAWWPWGNGKNISIRIAPFYKKISGSEKAEKNKQFKKWFGI
ncbi:MAG: hypothetical protein LLG40_16165 [Deltaproteobacteria bacterium]|nr:hypothetical protein [Deltaproteobacteria bacterium]